MKEVNLNQRSDYDVIITLLRQQTKKAKVLDIGCGNGELLYKLVTKLHIDGRGLEIDQSLVNEAVARGLAVIQGDVNTDLPEYDERIFDCVILSQTIQATLEPKILLEKLVKIGQYVIVSFPNFGYWKLATYLLLRGRMPISKTLPFEWYNTPNIHLCTIKDFFNLCDECNVDIVQAYAIKKNGKAIIINRDSTMLLHWQGLFAKQAVFMLKEKV